MEDIFEYIETINKNFNLELNKEQKIYSCYYCTRECYTLSHTFDIIIDNKLVFVCEDCEGKIAEFSYCHNCEEDIESYGSVHICTKCPENINTLCKKCNNLHDKIINVKH
jgi:hypothetical protein